MNAQNENKKPYSLFEGNDRKLFDFIRPDALSLTPAQRPCLLLVGA